LLEGVPSSGSGALEATTVGSRTGVGVDGLPPISFSTAALDTELDTFSCSPENKIQIDLFFFVK
jgi:hypothetical protein